jgi:hypothetical protein
VRVAPFFSKGLRVFAPALEAGPVPGGDAVGSSRKNSSV